MQYNNMVGLGAPAHGQGMYSPHQSYNTIGGGGVIGVGGDVGGGVGPFFQPGATANKYCSTAANDILLATTPAGGPCLPQEGSGLLVAPHPGSCLTSSLAAQVESCHAVPPAGSTFLAMHAGLGDAPRFNGTSTNCGAGPGACAPLSARVFADGPHDLGFRLTGTSGPAHGGLGAGSSAAAAPPPSPPGFLLHQFGPGGGPRDVTHGSGHLLGPSAFQWADIPILDDSDAVAAAAAAAAATIQDCWALNFPGDVDYGQPSRHVTMPAVCMYPSQTGVGSSLQVNKSINNNNTGSSSSSSNTSANIAESRLIACRGHNVSNIQAVRGNVMSAASQTGNSPRSVLPLDSSSSASAAAAASVGPGVGPGLGVHSAMHSEQDKCVYRQAETCANSHLSHRAQSDRRFCADADAKPVPVAIGDVDVDLTRSAAFVVQDDLESVASDAGGSKFRQLPSLSLPALPLANGPHPGVTNVNAATANVAAVLPYLSPTSQHGGPAPPNSHLYAAGGASLGAGPGDDSWSMRSSSSSSSRPLGGSACHWVPSCAAPAGNMSTNASANAVQAVVQAGDACPWQTPCKSSAPPLELPTNSRVSASVANDIHNYRKRLGDESMDLASKRMKDVTTPNVKANDLPVINTGVPTRSCNPMPSASIPSSSASASNVNHKSLGPALNTNLKPRARQGSANDPQSIAARHRRERISERLKVLQDLVPNGSKVDLVTMLEKAISYVKSLQVQVKFLTADEYWPDSSKACTSSPHVDALANDGSLPVTGIGCTSITNSLATCVKSELNPNSEPMEMPSIADTFVLEQGSELDSSI